jgi:pilus assembly protein Flp/PilA
MELSFTSAPVWSRRIRRKGVTHMSSILAFLKNDSGATAIEYGLIAAGISIAIIAVVNGLGTTLNAKFDSVSTQLK